MEKILKYSILFCIISAVFISDFSFSQETIKGVVVNISDGDTVTVWENEKLYKIALYGIDVPEIKQNFGQKAKKFTSDWVFNKDLIVIPKYDDKHNRIVGIIYIGNKCLNQELVKNGFAWVSQRSCTDQLCKKWLEFETFAKKNKIGLWVDKNPIPPWDFKKENP